MYVLCVCVQGSCMFVCLRLRVLVSMNICEEFVIEVMQVAFSCLIADVVSECEIGEAFG